MDLTNALERIEEIHAQIAKGEVFRGYRPIPVAIAGAIGLLAGWFQPRIVASGDDGTAFLWYWLCVAALNVALIGGVVGAAHLRERDPFARRHTRRVVGQFVPCLAAGAAVSLSFAALDPGFVRLLPGLWALLIGLGIFASRPYLARATGWVALFFLLAGTALLVFPTADLARLGTLHGTVFGVGLLGAAGVLHLDVPRDDRG
jgi:hypothetical protein